MLPSNTTPRLQDSCYNNCSMKWKVHFYICAEFIAHILFLKYKYWSVVSKILVYSTFVVIYIVRFFLTTVMHILKICIIIIHRKCKFSTTECISCSVCDIFTSFWCLVQITVGEIISHSHLFLYLMGTTFLLVDSLRN